MEDKIVQNKVMNILLLVSLFQLFSGCKDNGTGPKPEPFKNPREMTWVADTLETGDPNQLQLIPENLLVFSPNDAWLCCWADGPLGQMWRYDGKDWLVNDILKDVSGKPRDIAGASSNNLYAGGYIGDNVFIAKYNGSNWTDVYPGFYTVDPSKWLKGDILDMSTELSGNIWACGRNGLVMKYENNKWISDTVKVGYLETHVNSEYLLRSIVSFNNRIHLLGGIYDSNLKRYVNYHFQGEMNNWELLDSMIVDSPSSIIKWGDLGLFTNSKKLYSYGSLGIWEYLNNTWQKVYDFDGEMYDVYNISDNYMIAVSAFNTVLFFNGQVWEKISDIFLTSDPTFVFNNVWTDGYETIITGYGAVNNKQGTIVWHGK